MHILQLKHINLTIQINQRNKDNDNSCMTYHNQITLITKHLTLL